MFGNREESDGVVRRGQEKQQLRQQDDLFRSFAEISPDLFFRLSAAGHILYFSPASRLMFGSPPEQYKDRPYLAFIAPEDHALMEKSFHLLLAGVRDQEIVLRMVHRDGQQIWVEMYATPWFDGEQILGVQGILRDISGRKKQEDALRHNNRLLSRQVRDQHEELQQNALVLQNLLNTTSAGIAILRRGRFQYVNERMAQLTGYTAPELLGVHWGELFTGDAGRAGVDFALLPPESGLLQSVESRWRRKDGTLLDILFSTLPLAAGDLPQSHDASLTVLDITGRKQTERELQAAGNELEQVFNGAVPFCLLSLDCRVLKVNQAFCDFFECGREDILGRNGRDIWGGDACATDACSLRQLRAGMGRSYQEIDTVKQGKHLVCRLHAAPYVDATGRLSGAVITFFDGREQKKILADLLKTQQQLIQAEKLSAIGSLAASIGHEFNNPLCGVRSVVERMARKSGLAATDQGLLELALEQCDRMKRLIRDLQQFNMPFSDVRTEFDLHRAIDSVLLLLNKHLKMRKAVVRKEYGERVLLFTGVENQIKQALLNLIKNSGEALPDTGGEIRIQTRKERGAVHIILSDTGVGISEEHLPHLFEPFFTTKTAVKETGLGLSVSYGIVKGHQGEIRVESTPGEGTTCIVILPIAENAGKDGGR